MSPSTGLIEWTPGPEQVGEQVLRVRVTDSGGRWDEAYYYVDVVPANPPVIMSDPVNTGFEGQPYAYAVEATDPDPGDALAFSLDDAPDGMTINATDGIIQWLPGADDVGYHPVTVRVTAFEPRSV